MAWFIFGMVVGVVLYRYVEMFLESRPKTLDRDEIVEALREMFTTPPDSVEKMALVVDIESILEAMKAQVDTEVVAPERDRALQKKDKPAPEPTEEEKKIAKKRSKAKKKKK